MALDINTYLGSISKLSKVHRILIFAGTVVLLLGLYIWFVHIPKTMEITQLGVSITNIESQIALAKIKAKNLKI